MYSSTSEGYEHIHAHLLCDKAIDLLGFQHAAAQQVLIEGPNFERFEPGREESRDSISQGLDERVDDHMYTHVRDQMKNGDRTTFIITLWRCVRHEHMCEIERKFHSWKTTSASSNWVSGS